MTYKSTITIDGKLLKCTFSGKRNAATSRNATKMLIRKLESKQLKFMLLEVNLSGRFLPEETLKNSQKTIHQLKDRDITIAMVDHNQLSFHDNYLASVFAHEEKIQLKVFENVEEANKWLQYRMGLDEQS